MKKKKKIVVSDILDVMNDSDKVAVVFWSYGMYYSDTERDGMETVGDCKEEMNFDCLNAIVRRIGNDERSSCVVIQAEIVHYNR